MFSAVNWNKIEDPYSKLFWEQNVRQFWVDEEIPLADDKLAWMNLNSIEQDVYEKVLAGLTLLDTEQGSVGMPLLSQHVASPHAKAVLGFMGAMEHMHAKSYSSIFSTFSSSERIDKLFTWVQQHPTIQKKLDLVHQRYIGINSQVSLYLAMATSVMLESYLFYSGFFYPLYLAGAGKMTSSGEIINLIIRDEAIHGVFVGLQAQQVFAQFDAATQRRLNGDVQGILDTLHALETIYTKELYTPIGLSQDVERFSQYNADKALMNLGLEPFFAVQSSDINPIVLNGLRTETKNHDFFSTKGNGYIKTTHVEMLSDSDFMFN